MIDPCPPVPAGTGQDPVCPVRRPACRTRSVIDQFDIVTGPGPGEHAKRFPRPRRRVGAMSASDSSLEIERKYAVDAGFELPDLSGVPGVAAVTGPRTYHLTAVYHDTPGLRLAAARITLRRRSGRTDDGWPLKPPVGARGRRHAHAPL